MSLIICSTFYKGVAMDPYDPYQDPNDPAPYGGSCGTLELPTQDESLKRVLFRFLVRHPFPSNGYLGSLLSHPNLEEHVRQHGTQEELKAYYTLRAEGRTPPTKDVSTGPTFVFAWFLKKHPLELTLSDLTKGPIYSPLLPSHLAKHGGEEEVVAYVMILTTDCDRGVVKEIFENKDPSFRREAFQKKKPEFYCFMKFQELRRQAQFRRLIEETLTKVVDLEKQINTDF
ncbi:MAG: hypothetical protein LBD15_04160 [Holosporales bacterium]|nr:hypothetical protein [Holosporales bacterium]